MTIDEAVSNLEQITTRFDYRYGTNKMVNVVIYGGDIRTFDFVIDTIRKYQKIEQIIQSWNKTGGSTEEWIILDEIEGVLGAAALCRETERKITRRARIARMKYEDIKILLKEFLMNQYDIRPSLAERTVEEMFKKGVDYISKEDKNGEIPD